MWRLESTDQTISTAAPVRKHAYHLRILVFFLNTKAFFCHSHTAETIIEAAWFSEGPEASGDQHRGRQFRGSHLGHRAPAQVGSLIYLLQ